MPSGLIMEVLPYVSLEHKKYEIGVVLLGEI